VRIRLILSFSTMEEKAGRFLVWLEFFPAENGQLSLLQARQAISITCTKKNARRWE